MSLFVWVFTLWIVFLLILAVLLIVVMPYLIVLQPVHRIIALPQKQLYNYCTLIPHNHNWAYNIEIWYLHLGPSNLNDNPIFFLFSLSSLLSLQSISSLSPNLSLSISFSHFLYVIISIFLSLWLLSLFFSLYLIPSLSTPQLVYLLLHTFTLCLSLSHSVFLSVAASLILCPHSFSTILILE